MALPKNFLAALQEALAEHRARATLDALRRLAPTMTFAELHAVLASADGQRLGSTPVRALFEGAPPPPVAASIEPEADTARAATKPTKRSPAKTSKASKKPATKSAKKSAKKSARRSTSERHRRPTAVDTAIVELLAKLAKPAKSGLLRSRLRVSQTTLLRALKRLVDAGLVVTVDPHPRQTYALASAPTATSTDVTAPAQTASPTSISRAAKKPSKKAAKKATKKTAAAEPAATSAATSATAATSPTDEPSTSPARLDIKHLEVALLNVLQSSSDWMGATELREVVGGNRDHAYQALVGLVKSGQIERVGERQFTRYRIRS